MEPAGVLSASASASAPARPRPPAAGGCVDVCGPSGWLPWSGCVRRAAADAGAPVTRRDWRSPAGNCVASSRHRDAPGCQGRRAGVSRAEESGQLRPPLIASVHRIPGSESEAQEAVREAWLCWAASPAYPSLAQGLPGRRGHPPISRTTAGGDGGRSRWPGGRRPCARGRRGRRHRGGGAREGEAVKPGEASGHGWAVPPRTRQSRYLPGSPGAPRSRSVQDVFRLT